MLAWSTGGKIDQCMLPKWILGLMLGHEVGKSHCNWCSGGMFLESFVTFLQKLEPAVHSDATTSPVR